MMADHFGSAREAREPSDGCRALIHWLVSEPGQAAQNGTNAWIPLARAGGETQIFSRGVCSCILCVVRSECVRMHYV